MTELKDHVVGTIGENQALYLEDISELQLFRFCTQLKLEIPDTKRRVDYETALLERIKKGGVALKIDPYVWCEKDRGCGHQLPVPACRARQRDPASPAACNKKDCEHRLFSKKTKKRRGSMSDEERGTTQRRPTKSSKGSKKKKEPEAGPPAAEKQNLVSKLEAGPPAAEKQNLVSKLEACMASREVIEKDRLMDELGVPNPAALRRVIRQLRKEKGISLTLDKKSGIYSKEVFT